MIEAVKQRVWRSRPYVEARRRLGRATRPLRRLEVALVYRFDLSKPVPESPASVPLEIRLATEDEVVGMVADLKRPPDRELRPLFAGRLRSGFLCFTGWVGSELVAYNWIQLRAGVDDGNLIDLGDGEAHMLDAYTVEHRRGYGIHGAINREMLVHLKRNGYRYAYSRLSVTQRRSPKALRRLGWEVTGTIARVRSSPGRPVLTLRGSAHPWRRLST